MSRFAALGDAAAGEATYVNAASSVANTPAKRCAPPQGAITCSPLRLPCVCGPQDPGQSSLHCWPSSSEVVSAYSFSSDPDRAVSWRRSQSAAGDPMALDGATCGAVQSLG